MLIKIVDGFDPKRIKDKLSLTELNPDISYLSENQTNIINILIEVAKIIDDVFYKQKLRDNLLLRDEIDS